jgi:hypothetical protein
MSCVPKNSDLLALRAYVTRKDATQYNDLPQDMVLLDLTHSNLKQQHIEIRFYLTDTLDTLQARIYQKTGTPHAFQYLQFFSAGVAMAEHPDVQRDDEAGILLFNTACECTVSI